jgi:hypothetical protein
LEEEAPIISLFSMNFSILAISHLKLVSSVGERMDSYTFLGMVSAGMKEFQSL